MVAPHSVVTFASQYDYELVLSCCDHFKSSSFMNKQAALKDLQSSTSFHFINMSVVYVRPDIKV